MSISKTKQINCGTDSTVSGFKGAIDGALGLIGLGGLGKNNNDNELTKAQENLKDVQAKWTEKLEEIKEQISEDEMSFLETTIEDVEDQQKNIDEILSEKIKKNTLMIGMLLFLVTFLILFDLF